MSRVTIDDIASDYFHDTSVINGKSATVSNVEIVPRKIVEMIIEMCKQDSAEPCYHDCIKEEARDIKRYAESLLKQFEEGEQ